MRLLLDTNVFISSEPAQPGDEDHVTRLSLELAQVASGGHQLLVHPSVSDEIAHDPDPQRRRRRELVQQRYPRLEQPPALTDELLEALKHPTPGSHDWYDAELLAAVYKDAVHGLVTEDAGVHKRARWIGVEDRVHTVKDALLLIRALNPQPSDFVPSVEEGPLHSLDLGDRFFDSLREDYPGFDAWFRGAARAGRRAFVVRGDDLAIAGICIVKGTDREIGAGSNPAKLSTFKVSPEFRGSRYGELLLKAVFRTTRGVHDALWVTVYEKHFELVTLLERFGFQLKDTVRGERRYLKSLVPDAVTSRSMSALDFHVRYGPPALRPEPSQTFIVPIQPMFYEGLFPDSPDLQIGLFAPRPYGNALRKAYLSHAGTRLPAPGATLLFYRSGDAQAVAAVGVLEAVKVSSDPDEILSFVGTRTVYPAAEVIEMTRRGDVVAYLFRQDRFLEPPLRLSELVANGVITAPPQSTLTVRTEGFSWLAARLGA